MSDDNREFEGGNYAKDYLKKLNQLSNTEFYQDLFQGNEKHSNPKIDSAKNSRFGELRDIFPPKAWNTLVEILRSINSQNSANDELGNPMPFEYVFVRLAADLKRFDGKRLYALDIVPEGPEKTEYDKKVSLLFNTAEAMERFSDSPVQYLDFVNAVKELYPEETYPVGKKLIHVSEEVWDQARHRLSNKLGNCKTSADYIRFLSLYSSAKTADEKKINELVILEESDWGKISRFITANAAPGYARVFLTALAQKAAPGEVSIPSGTLDDWNICKNELQSEARGFGNKNPAVLWQWIRRANNFRDLKIECIE